MSEDLALRLSLLWATVWILGLAWRLHVVRNELNEARTRLLEVHLKHQGELNRLGAKVTECEQIVQQKLKFHEWLRTQQFRIQFHDGRPSLYNNPPYEFFDKE